MNALLLAIALQVSGTSGTAQPSSSASIVVVDAGLNITASAPVVLDTKTLPKAPDDGDVVDLVTVLLNAYQKGDWRLALISALMLVMWGLRKTLLSSITEKRTDLIPWLTLAFATAGGAVLSLQAGKPIKNVIVDGVVIGLATSGTWSLVGKHITGLVEKLISLFRAAPAPVQPAAQPVPPPATPVATPASTEPPK